MKNSTEFGPSSVYKSPSLTFEQQVVLALCHDISWTYRYDLYHQTQRAKIIVDLATEIAKATKL